MLESLISLDQQITLFFNGSHSLFTDGLARTSTSTWTWIPLAIALLLVIIKNNKTRNIFLIVLSLAMCVLIADQVASGICKPYFHRFRPTQDPQLMYLIDVVDGYRGGKYGFFSSHAANTFSLAIFLSLLIRNKALTLSVISWALLNCWTRIYLGVHYFGDLLVGIIFGSLVGWGVYTLYKRISKTEIDKTHRPDIQTTSGYVLNDVYLFVSTLLASYIYVLIAGACF